MGAVLGLRSVVVQFDCGPGFEADAVGQRHHADRGTTAKAALGAEDIQQEVGQAGGHFVDVLIVGCADHEIQGADDTFHAVERARRLFDAAQQVQTRLAGGRIALICRQVSAETALVGDQRADLSHVAGQEQQGPGAVVWLHRAVVRAIIAGQVEIGDVEAHLVGELFRGQGASRGVSEGL